MRLLLSTVPDIEAARSIARALVEERDAACVNVVPGLTSIYRWKGKVEEAAEVLLLVKVRAERAEAVSRRIAELHPYDCPEVVSLDPSHVHPPYLDWLRGATKP